jgi:predicted  nucleic acid-binding Zn-ribbon protein
MPTEDKAKEIVDALMKAMNELDDAKKEFETAKQRLDAAEKNFKEKNEAYITATM